MNKKLSFKTVLGEVNCCAIGITYSHEHLFVKPNDKPKYKDYTLDDFEKSKSEVEKFKELGGRMIIEMTPINYGRNPLGYRKISQQTGVKIICCTGFHKKEFLPEWVYQLSTQQIINYLIKEIETGIDNTGVKPGILKIGTSFKKIFPIEAKLLKVISEVHKKTNLAISTHCDKGTMAVEQAELFLQAGVKPENILLGHVDLNNNLNYLSSLCKKGFNISIDHLGRELDNNDESRVNLVKKLIEQGYEKQIFLSGDMGKKSYLEAYGGRPGLSYIIDKFSLYLNNNGISKTKIKKILLDNPARFFCC